MGLFSNPKEHAANPPSTWKAVKVREHHWLLTTAAGERLGTYTTEREVEEQKVDGPWVRLYEKESRWYAGEEVPGWKPYKPRNEPSIPADLRAAAQRVGYRIEAHKMTGGHCWDLRIYPVVGAPYRHPVTKQRMVYNRRRDVLKKDVPKKIAQMLAERAVEGVTMEDAGRLTLQEAMDMLQRAAA